MTLAHVEGSSVDLDCQWAWRLSSCQTGEADAQPGRRVAVSFPLWVDTALDLSRGAGAPGIELRAAISFAEIGQMVDRSSDSQRVLTDAIGRIASGHDAPIVLQANELLASIT